MTFVLSPSSPLVVKPMRTKGWQRYRHRSPFVVLERLAVYELEDVDRLVAWSEQHRRNREKILERAIRSPERYVDDRAEIDSFAELYAECAVVALWRCVELFRKRLIAHSLGPAVAKTVYQHPKFCQILERNGISESTLCCAKSVNELRCLNNAVKHEARVTEGLAGLPRWRKRIGGELGDLRHSLRSFAAIGSALHE